jgi:hypothetical protein
MELSGYMERIVVKNREWEKPSDDPLENRTKGAM